MSEFPNTDKISEEWIYPQNRRFEKRYSCNEHAFSYALICDEEDLGAPDLFKDYEMTESERRIAVIVNDMLSSYSVAFLDAFAQWLCEFVDWYEDERGM